MPSRAAGTQLSNRTFSENIGSFYNKITKFKFLKSKF